MALYGVNPNPVVICKLVKLSDPPSVIVPDVVIVPPVRVNPLTDPDVAMLVTVPVLVVYPGSLVNADNEVGAPVILL